jgi:hypothetical protein
MSRKFGEAQPAQTGPAPWNASRSSGEPGGMPQSTPGGGAGSRSGTGAVDDAGDCGLDPYWTMTLVVTWSPNRR